ncbi:unnamed protein product, partial [Rotaria sordida]
QIPIMLTLRSSRLIESINDPNRKFDFSHTIIQNLICPPPPPRIKVLSNAQRLRKVIFELVETERSYVQ